MRKLSASGVPAVRPSLATLVDRQVDALDKLVAELRGGIRGPSHFNELEARAQEIGRALVSAFRMR